MNTIFSQPCMAGEFSPITKDEACKKEKKKKKKKKKEKKKEKKKKKRKEIFVKLIYSI